MMTATVKTLCNIDLVAENRNQTMMNIGP